MTHKTTLFKLFRVFRLTGIFVFIISLAALFAGLINYSQEYREELNASVLPVINNETGTQDVSGDDLCSITAIRRFLSGHIRYPDPAVQDGQSGTVELYVRINSEGRVNEILALQPVRDYVVVDEIEISGKVPAGKEIDKSSRHEILLIESRRVVMSLPRCDIQEIFGQTLKLTFKFVLE